MHAVNIPIPYQIPQQIQKHLSSCLQLTPVADFSQDVIQEAN